MSELNIDQVKKIAKLANLELSEKQLGKFTTQLTKVIDYNVEQLAKADTNKVEPLLNVSGLTNSTRDDQTQPGLTQEQVLQNSDETHNGFFKVKQILDQS